MSVVAKKYRPHLPTLMSLCEVNYMLLLRMLADKEQVGEQRCFFISDFLSYRVNCQRSDTIHDVNDDKPRGKYSIAYNLTELLRPKMVVRLYHDARMAEVISNQDVQTNQAAIRLPKRQHALT